MRCVTCPSGAQLTIYPAPFPDAKALYKALLREARGVAINSKMELQELYKELFCLGFSSDTIEKELWKCLVRCTYNSGKGDLKIDENTFEPLEARDDYMVVCMEVAKENVLPFVKSLYAEFQKALSMTEGTQA